MEKRKGPDHFQFKGFFAQIPRRQYRAQRPALASRLGLRPQDLDKILRSEVEATPEQIVQIARHFKLQFDDLSLDAARTLEPPPVPPKAQPPAPADLEKAKKATRAAILAGLQPSIPPVNKPDQPPKTEPEQPPKIEPEQSEQSSKPAVVEKPPANAQPPQAENRDN